MKKKHIEQSAREFVKDMLDVLFAKNEDYAGGEEDRLIFFKDMAKESGQTPRRVVWFFLQKHLYAIKTHVRGNELKSEELRSRCIDAANFLILYVALEEDEHGVALGKALERMTGKTEGELIEELGEEVEVEFNATRVARVNPHLGDY